MSSVCFLILSHFPDRIKLLRLFQVDQNGVNCLNLMERV